MPRKLNYNERRVRETEKKMQKVVSYRERDWTFREIGEKLGVTTSYAATLYRRAEDEGIAA